jgi:uncharacterized membrane protein YgcG
MRLLAQIHVKTSTTSVVERDPTFWEKVRRSFGRKIDLETDEVRVELEASAVVDGARRALARLGVDNAVSLMIDDVVIFQDTQGKAGDLGDLVIALSEHAPVFGRGFRELRFAVEHTESGLHLLVETRARTTHRRDEPSTIVSIAGRLRELEPRPGEEPEAYRARVEPMTKDFAALETARLQFGSFVGRLEAALRATMPEAELTQIEPEAKVVRPPQTALARPPERNPARAGYDPFPLYYPHPMGFVLDAMLISSFMHAMHPPHHIMVVQPSGAPIGSAADVAAHPETLAASHDEGGSEASGGDDSQASDGWADDGGEGDGDLGGGDFDGGGDFGGGGGDD